MSKTMNTILRYIGYILFRPIWWLERLIPRSKNIWIFGAWYGQKYSDNSKWFYEYVLENEPHLKAVWITKNKDVYKELCARNKSVCMSSSLKGVLWCLRAKYAFLTSGVVDVNALALNGCKQIWLWHGMPLKKILNSESTYTSAKKKAFQRMLNPYYSFAPSFTLTSSDFFVPYLKEAFMLPESKILKTGLPRCDAFFTRKKEKLITDLKTHFPNARFLLYMPTFRMSSQLNGLPFNPFVQQFCFDEKEFVAFLEDCNIVFLYKPHFADSSVNVQINSTRFLCVTDGCFEDLYVLLNSVDGLITDYSSVFFDFLATKKPVYLLPFDYEEYVNTSRSHFFNMYDEMHGMFCNNWKDFYKQLLKAQTISLLDRLEEDRIKFATYLNGRSCESLFKILKQV
ncbi:MAG: CDP-glycerol glycerophosphotransferase family protein [Treponemataceae bacterium]|nr:CDP-glycerol glycerophosphotransferase family protein [Treponemataceae bacterium]